MEARTGSGTLHEAWGGGFEVTVYRNGRFEKLSNIVYVFYEEAADHSRSIKRLVKFYYCDEHLFIRTATVSHRSGGDHVIESDDTIYVRPLRGVGGMRKTLESAFPGWQFRRHRSETLPPLEQFHGGRAPRARAAQRASQARRAVRNPAEGRSFADCGRLSAQSSMAEAPRSFSQVTHFLGTLSFK